MNAKHRSTIDVNDIYFSIESIKIAHVTIIGRLKVEANKDGNKFLTLIPSAFNSFEMDISKYGDRNGKTKIKRIKAKTNKITVKLDEEAIVSGKILGCPIKFK